MKNKTKEVRTAVKNLIVKVGYDNITNQHINELVETVGCTYCQVQNAMSYFKYSSTQDKFREQSPSARIDHHALTRQVKERR